MHEAVQSYYASLLNNLQQTALPEDRKRSMVESLPRLSKMYAKFAETNSTRDGEELTRNVQLLLHGLKACPKAQKMEEPFREGLRTLHEELGIPALHLKAAKKPAKAKKK